VNARLAGALFAGVVGNVLSWVASVNWGGLVTTSTAVVLGFGGLWFGLCEQRTRAEANRKKLETDAEIARKKLETDAEIAGKQVALDAKLARQKLESEARIARTQREEDAHKGTLTERVEQLTAAIVAQEAEATRQRAELVDSLEHARATLHKINNEREADDKRRLEEILNLRAELEDARAEIRQLRAQLDRNTAIVAAAGQQVAAVGAQVRANADAIARAEADRAGDTPS
jgi:chromosome segregation ATPase